jgi:selenophosphate synthetase-related protein
VRSSRHARQKLNCVRAKDVSSSGVIGTLKFE